MIITAPTFEQLLSEPFGPGRGNPFSDLGKIRYLLNKAQKGDRFILEKDNHDIYRLAEKMGKKITRRQLPDGNWLYERIR